MVNSAVFIGDSSHRPNTVVDGRSPRARAPASGFPSGSSTRPVTDLPAARVTFTVAAWSPVFGSTGTRALKVDGWQRYGWVLMNGPFILSLKISCPTATGYFSLSALTATSPGPSGTTRRNFPSFDPHSSGSATVN